MIYQLNLQSCSTFLFPSILKTCKVIPIYKKDSLNCSNYQPISLLSNIDKILERIMYNCLYKFLETNNLIYSLQFGFRQKHSNSNTLIHLTDKIRVIPEVATKGFAKFLRTPFLHNTSVGLLL